MLSLIGPPRIFSTKISPKATNGPNLVQKALWGFDESLALFLLFRGVAGLLLGVSGHGVFKVQGTEGYAAFRSAVSPGAVPL